MKKKGFTLVELLAVIVILAVIALISTPIILNVIEESKKGAAEQSALGYIDALEKQIVINSMDEDASNDIGNGTFDIKDLEVNIKGAKPTSGSVTITKGKVETATITIGDYSVTVDENGKVTTAKKGTTEEKYTVYANGTAVYYNPETNTKCNESEAVSTTGTKTGCMKWYTFNDEGETASTVNMILDHNTTVNIVWSTTGSNTNGPKELLEQLKSDTENWSNKLIRKDDYSLNRGSVKYTIDYSGYKARLITVEEIYKIIGIDVDYSEKDIYFDSKDVTASSQCKKGNISDCRYGWLYDLTYNCKAYGCNMEDSNNNIGYWTATASSVNSAYARRVCFEGRFSSYTVNQKNYGLRPVVTVSKITIK